MGPDSYIGNIAIFGGPYNPANWATCDGTLLSIAGNEALYSIIGTMYGGDGRTNFALPDLRGRVPLHRDSRPGTFYSFLQSMMGGQEIVSLTIPQMPAHTHAVTSTVSPLVAQSSLALVGTSTTSVLNVSDQNATQPTATAGSSLGTTVLPGSRSNTPCNTYNNLTPNVELNSASITSTTSVTLKNVGVTGTVNIVNSLAGGDPNLPEGQSSPHANIQPCMALRFLICTNGLYPVRPS
ncbi:MAG: tail fiber protein [Verrucomicrobiota bacterium JB022]|nr:tail fiber protein [Verrucomicrobiota bacterium JB022]